VRQGQGMTRRRPPRKREAGCGAKSVGRQATLDAGHSGQQSSLTQEEYLQKGFVQYVMKRRIPGIIANVRLRRTGKRKLEDSQDTTTFLCHSGRCHVIFGRSSEARKSIIISSAWSFAICKQPRLRRGRLQGCRVAVLEQSQSACFLRGESRRLTRIIRMSHI